MSLEWPELRRRFHARFGTACVDLAVQVVERPKQRHKSVRAFALEMNRLMKRAGIRDASALAVLTNGLPPSYRAQLHAAKPKTFDDWLATALLAEHDEKLTSRYRRPADFLANDAKSKAKLTGKGADKKQTDKPPPFTCMFCENRGIQNAMHWHRDCPYRNEAPPNSSCSRHATRGRGRGQGSRQAGWPGANLALGDDEDALVETLNSSGGLGN